MKSTMGPDFDPKSRTPVAGPKLTESAPLLLGLPQGLCVSGVTIWAVRLANALARRGRHVSLVLHREPADQQRLDIPIDDAIERIDLRDLPDFDTTGGDLSPFVPPYRDAVWSLARRFASPVVVSPNLHGDCYGIAAELSRTQPETLRVVGWQHSDIEYDTRVLAHYEPIVHAFVGVSHNITTTLRDRLPHRSGDVANIPYGVPVPAKAPRREPLIDRGHHRPLRLIYTGRMEHNQKRICALPSLSAELDRRGIEHDLILVGDGPAAEEIDMMLADCPHARRRPPADPCEVARLLLRCDAFVLASRYEGLSLSMLEALAHGCVPIVTRTESGAGQAIEDGINGLIADVSPDTDESNAAKALADAVELFAGSDHRAMSRAAWQTTRDRFSMQRHVDAVTRLLDDVAAAPPRSWPADRPCAFTSSNASAGSGTVPPDGSARLRDVLAKLAGRRIVIHGVGRHTVELAAVFADSPAKIVAFTDDDRAHHGKELWNRPIIAPDQAYATGATDVLISSWMHTEAIWKRRKGYEDQGLTVHRIYQNSNRSAE